MEEEIIINEEKIINEENNTSEDNSVSEDNVVHEDNINDETVTPLDDKKAIDNPEGVIEAILFAMGDSVEYKKLSDALNMSVGEVKSIVSSMQEKFANDKNKGVEIVELEDSVQMCTKAEMYEYLIKVAKTPKNMSLSDTLLETLSIIAYKQPVTRAEIEKIRGVSCDHAVNKLLEFNLICELGRLNAPGRPLLFGTTEEFLRSFGVKSVDDLPTIAADRLEEFKKEAAEEVQLKLDI